MEETRNIAICFNFKERTKFISNLSICMRILKNYNTHFYFVAKQSRLLLIFGCRNI